MVLNPNGIEPTCLKLDSCSPGAGFIPIITFKILNHIKKRIQETFNAVFKNEFNLVLGSIPRLPKKTWYNN